jgi:PEP-CTERM motif
LSTYHLSALGDTPGIPSAFGDINPGPRLNGNDTTGDALFSLTLTNLPAGSHVLTFERLLPLAIGDPLPQLRVDDVLLTVTAVPEPGSALMLCAGLAGLAAWRRRYAGSASA